MKNPKYDVFISHTSKDKKKYVDKLLEKAAFCSNDPVCSCSNGQGKESLNLAACHSCVLLPETCCENFNTFLDRGMIAGTMDNQDIGFF